MRPILNNNFTKKVILSLVVIVGLAAGGWGQMALSNMPTNFSLNGFDNIQDTTLGVTKNLNGPWTFSSQWDYGTYKGKVYTNTTGESATISTMANAYWDPVQNKTVYTGGETHQINFLWDLNPAMGQQRNISFGSTNGDFNNMVLAGMPSGVTGFPSTITSSNYVNGISAQGYLVGGTYVPPQEEENEGLAALIGEQAYELSLGLNFEAGYWTPAQ